MRTPQRKLTRQENGRQVREALVRAAMRVVARDGFAKASVQRITAECGVAQGTLYTYFDSLQQLLDELLPSEGLLMLAALGRAIDRTAPYFEQERQGFRALSDYLHRKPLLLRLIAEAEIAAPASYVRHYANIEPRYRRALQHARKRGEVRALSERAFGVAGSVLSAARGAIMIGFCEPDARRLFHRPPLPDWVVDAYVKFARRGIGAHGPLPRRLVARDAIGARVARSGAAPDTRDAILDAAARLIGRHGDTQTTIADICAAAQIAVGTFYGHFASRDAMFDALLARMRSAMLADVNHATRSAQSFVEYECCAFDGFFAHLLRNPWFTRIEAEAAVWAPASYIRHFRELVQGYVQAMQALRSGDELADYDERELPVLACVFIAARHDLATRLVVRSGDAHRLPDWVRDAYLEFVARGLE